MRLINFEPEHLLWVMDVSKNVPREQDDLEALAERAKTKGPCLTLIGEDGQTLACGGLSMMFKHSAEMWVRLSNKAGPHAVREIKCQVYRWIETLHLDRLQATGPVSWEALPRWWTWLGLHKEAVLEKYGPYGEDYFMYAWVRK